MCVVSGSSLGVLRGATRSARAQRSKRARAGQQASAAQRQRQRQRLRSAASRVRASDFVLCSATCGWWVRVSSFWRGSGCGFGLCGCCVSVVLSTLVGAGSGGGKGISAGRAGGGGPIRTRLDGDSLRGCRSSSGWFRLRATLETRPRPCALAPAAGGDRKKTSVWLASNRRERHTDSTKTVTQPRRGGDREMPFSQPYCVGKQRDLLRGRCRRAPL